MSKNCGNIQIKGSEESRVLGFEDIKKGTGKDKNMGIQAVPMLSKSRFLSGLQCPLCLWCECYNRDLIPENSPGLQAIFDAGHDVGRLATRLYASKTVTPASIDSSLPHWGPEERRSIASCFAGITTWQRICREFEIDFTELPDKVDD